MQRSFCRAAVLFLGLVLSISAAPALADSITGGATSVALDTATLGILSGQGVSVSTLGTASLSGATVTFPITGGTTSWTGDIIDHNGSGLQFADGSKTLDIENFVINTATDLITGKVVIGSTVLNGVNLFDIGPGLHLTLDSAAGGALASTFDIPNYSGASIGTATVSPIVATPEPSSLLLLAFGILGVALLAGKRS